MTNGIDSYSVPETARYVPEANGLTHDANSLIPDSFAPEVLQTHAEAETGLMSLYERLFGTNRSKVRRLASVDGFRAITLFLMIFVNNLWSLYKVPAWLGHAGEAEDRLGLADTAVT